MLFFVTQKTRLRYWKEFSYHYHTKHTLVLIILLMAAQFTIQISTYRNANTWQWSCSSAWVCQWSPVELLPTVRQGKSQDHERLVEKLLHTTAVVMQQQNFLEKVDDWNSCDRYIGSLYLSLKPKSKTLVSNQSLIWMAINLVLDRAQIKQMRKWIGFRLKS